MLDNPYASPTITSEPRRGRGDRLAIRFRAARDEELWQSIRHCKSSQAAEALGCVACLPMVVLGVILAIWIRESWCVPAGYLGGALIGFTARGLAMRNFPRRYLRKMRKRMDLAIGSPCHLVMTRTKLLLDGEGRSWVWPLRRIAILLHRPSKTGLSYVALTIVAHDKLIIPISDSADFGDSSPEELQRELQLRSGDCRRRCLRFGVRMIRKRIFRWF